MQIVPPFPKVSAGQLVTQDEPEAYFGLEQLKHVLELLQVEQ